MAKSNGIDAIMAVKEPAQSGMPKIPLPQGFVLPDTVREGESFDIAMRGYIDEDNQLCIEKINGMAYEEGGEEAEELEPETETEEAPMEEMDIMEAARQSGY